MPTYLCKITNNNHICSILGRRKMTQKHKKETQKTQNEMKIPHDMSACHEVFIIIEGEASFNQPKCCHLDRDIH